MLKQHIAKFKQKYAQMPAPVKAGFGFTACNFLSRGITMITTPIFTRLLPQEEYGIISTYSSWNTVFVLFGTLSLFKALMNENKDQVLSAICSLSILVSLFWFIMYLCFSQQISSMLGLSTTLTFCLFVSLFFQGGFSCWALHQRYIYNYKTLIIITLLQTVLSSFVDALCIINIAPIAECRILPSTIIGIIIAIFIYTTVFKKNKTLYDKSIWRFALSFCIVLMPHYLSEFILQSSDKLMINYMCGPKDVAIYSIAYAVGSIIVLITGSINSSFSPYSYQQIKAKNYQKLATVSNQVMILVAIILVLIMLFSREIVLIFGGYKYIDSIPVIIPICLGVYFNYMFQLFARIQEYFEHKITVVVPSILCAILNIILNYIYIPKYGFQAASYTTFFCYLSFCLLHYCFYKKVCAKDLNGVELYNTKGLFTISISTTAISAVVFFINQILWLKYTLIAILFIVFIAKFKVFKTTLNSIIFTNQQQNSSNNSSDI